MAYAEYTAQFPTSIADASDLYEPDNDGTSTTLLQNITGASPGEGGKLYLTDNSNFGTDGGVVNIVSTGERISYSDSGTDGTGDYVTVVYRALPGGAGASSATALDTVRDIISAEHFKRLSRELIAVQTNIGANSFTAGSVIFQGASDLDEDNANFFWDDLNNRLGLGTTLPARLLEAQTSGTNSQTQVRLSTYNDQAAFTTVLEFAKSHTDTPGSNVATIDTEILGSIDWLGVDSATNLQVSARISATQNGAASTGVPTDLIFYTEPAAGGLTERIRIDSAGLTGINKSSSIGAQLHVVSGAAGTVGLRVATAATPSVSVQEWYVNATLAADINVTDAGTAIRLINRDLGNNVAGPVIETGRNTNAGAEGGSAGTVLLRQGDNTSRYLWHDASSNLRTHTAQPTGSSGSPTVSDTAGTVVGTQTSMLAAKNILGSGPTPAESIAHLKHAAKNALRAFKYKSGAFDESDLYGIVTDYAPRYGFDNGKSLNEITILGDLINGITNVVERLEKLERK